MTDTSPDADEAEEEQGGRRYWHWFELPTGGDGEGSKSNKLPVAWQTHTDDVVKNTRDIVGKLLPDDLATLFILAAECHDLGKRRRLVHMLLRNTHYPAVVLGKYGKKYG